MIGTTAAVKQIAKLILNNEITGRMAEIWLSSLSLIQNPSKEMLSEIAVSSPFEIFLTALSIQYHDIYKMALIEATVNRNFKNFKRSYLHCFSFLASNYKIVILI